MSEIKIPFGRDINGKMVSVDTVDRGLDCNCCCSVCGARLVARKGEVNQHHFAHYIEPENCAETRETSIHKFAKELIRDVLDLRLPDDLDLGQMQSAECEPWLDGIRPDVLVQFNEPVAVEIRVAHRVPTEKIIVFATRKLAAVEIDLSTYHADKSEDEWHDLVLRRAERFWLFQPIVVRARIEEEARREAERRLKIEREAREAREEAERIEQERIDATERRRERREYLARQDREFEELVSAEISRRRQPIVAMAERIKEHDPLIDGLKICADTKWHLKEWERRKTEAVSKRLAR